MKLEDAQLCLLVAPGDLDGADAGAGFWRGAIAAGVDLIQLTVPADSEAAALLAQARAACREDDALLIVDGDPVTAIEAETDGVYLAGPDLHVGYARSVLGAQGLIGLSSRSADEAAMALGLEPDYLLHYFREASAPFPAATEAGQTIVFAAGISTPEEAREAVDLGIRRLAVRWRGEAGGDATAALAPFSRLLGRSL